ncbi:hypothetical protein D3C86_2174940 [compost metagenome]
MPFKLKTLIEIGILSVHLVFDEIAGRLRNKPIVQQRLEFLVQDDDVSLRQFVHIGVDTAD